MYYDDLISSIRKRIDDHGARLKTPIINTDLKALVFPTSNKPLIIVNKANIRRNMLPLVILHEYAHLVLGTDCSDYNLCFKNRVTIEKQANTEAIKILFDVCDCDIKDFESLGCLIHCFNIPDSLLPDVENIAKEKIN